MAIAHFGGIDASASEYSRFDSPLQLKILLEDKVVFEKTGKPGETIQISGIKTPTGYCIDRFKSEQEYTLTRNKADKGEEPTYEFTFIDQSVTLTAVLRANNYKIVFDKNNKDDMQSRVTGSMTNITVYYNQERQLPKNYLKREGYDFIGWNTQADGKGTMYADRATVKNLTAVKGETVTLYAIWGPEGTAPAASTGSSTASSIFSLGSVWLYIGIGILLIAVIAVIIFVVREKKQKQQSTKS